jgi:hypothetical protein
MYRYRVNFSFGPLVDGVVPSPTKRAAKAAALVDALARAALLGWTPESIPAGEPMLRQVSVAPIGW